MTHANREQDVPHEDIDTLRALLRRLPAYLSNNWQTADVDKAYFADGHSGENGIRTNTNIVFAIAVLLKHADACGLDDQTQGHLRTKVRSLTRFLLTSYTGAEGACTDGRQWGLSWQSSWWASKLALGADMLGGVLSEDDQTAVRQLIAREATRHCQRLIPTGLMEDTKAEETAWDAEALAAALSLNPQDDAAADWHQRLIAFAINTFSRPSDQTNPQQVDGLPVKDVVRSCNIHEDGTLENHGANHFCYVASPLISKAWCSYALHLKGDPAPAALGWNVAPVWNFAEPIFLKNRFTYIGGQDWARYTYGEYFILPALLFLSSIGCGTRTGTIFRARLRMLNQEAEASEDGSFFGARFTKGQYFGQYAKYETDCFACVALTLDMLCSGAFDPGPEQPPAPRLRRISPESLTCYARQDSGLFSFSWRTLTTPVPNISFIPFADDSLAEWQAGNLLGTLWMPRQTLKWIGVKAMDAHDTGLRVQGQHALRNQNGETVAHHHLDLELDNDLLHISSRYTAGKKLRAIRVTGLNWAVPNDMFNGYTRRYYFQNTNGDVDHLDSSGQGIPTQAPRTGGLDKIKRRFRTQGTTHSFGPSGWLNIDGQVGIIQRGSDSFVQRKYTHKTSTWGSLNLETVETPGADWRFNVPAGTPLLDTRVSLHFGSQDQTRALAETLKSTA